METLAPTRVIPGVQGLTYLAFIRYGRVLGGKDKRVGLFGCQVPSSQPGLGHECLKTLVAHFLRPHFLT